MNRGTAKSMLIQAVRTSSSTEIEKGLRLGDRTVSYMYRNHLQQSKHQALVHSRVDRRSSLCGRERKRLTRAATSVDQLGGQFATRAKSAYDN